MLRDFKTWQKPTCQEREIAKALRGLGYVCTHSTAKPRIWSVLAGKKKTGEVVLVRVSPTLKDKSGFLVGGGSGPIAETIERIAGKGLLLTVWFPVHRRVPVVTWANREALPDWVASLGWEVDRETP